MGDKVNGLKKAFRKVGYTAKAASGIASKSSENGVSGGVAVAAPNSRSVTMRDSTHVCTDHAPKLHGEEWIIAVIHRRGLSLAYVVAYFVCGGYGDVNRRRVAALRTTLIALGLPYIIAADWNATPDELRDSGMLGDLVGRIRTPANATHTCTAGQERML